MKITRNDLSILITGLICLALLSATSVAADQIFAPEYLWERGIASKTDPIEIANTHLGISYRDDGTLDSQGHFTTFDQPDRFFETPGLNCSGLVVSVCRFLFDRELDPKGSHRNSAGKQRPNFSIRQGLGFRLEPDLEPDGRKATYGSNA